MRQSPFIWLGSGRTRRRNVARKGSLLDQAARFGLPVPRGGILLDDFYRICLENGVVEAAAGEVAVPDPVWLHEVLYNEVRFPRLEKLVAVRSALAVPVGESRNKSRARLNIDSTDPAQLADALRDVWSAMIHLKNDQPLDILVMEMAADQSAGEAWSDADSATDQVVVKAQTGDGLPDNFALKKISAFQRSSAEIPPFARRLQKLLRGVRRTFGKGEWHIEWVDDGAICWLLQVD